MEKNYIKNRIDKATAKINPFERGITTEERTRREEALTKARRLIHSGAILARKRDNVNLTQAQLAQKLGVSESYIQKIELGDADPTRDLTRFNKLIKELKWDRRLAYNTYKTKETPTRRPTSIEKAKMELASAMIDSKTALEFITRVLIIQAAYKSEFKPRQINFEYLLKDFDYLASIDGITEFQYAKLFLEYAAAKLSDKQWIMIFGDLDETQLKKIDGAIWSIIDQIEVNKKKQLRDLTF